MYDMKNLTKFSKLGELAPDAMKAFVSRVILRLPVRMLRFWRSTYDVLMCWGFGRPSTVVIETPVHSAGE